MVIIPNERWRRLHYYFTTNFKSKVEIGLLLGYFGSLASIVSMFWKGIVDPSNTLALVLIATFALIALLYSKGYFFEKEQKKRYQKTLWYGHKIQESIRTINEADSDDDYVGTLQSTSKEICALFKGMLEHLDYAIEDVCIKVFDINQNKIKVVARANDKRVDELDTEEALDKNPFASILLRVHSVHDEKLGECKEIAALPQNCHKNLPVFFAFGDIHNKNIPIFLDKIFPNYEVKAEYNHEKYLNDLKTRTKNKYNSCFAVMITKPVSQNDPRLKDKKLKELQLDNHVGFIGFDSKDKQLFDFFDFNLVHIFAGVADSLYTNISFYKDEVL